MRGASKKPIRVSKQLDIDAIVQRVESKLLNVKGLAPKDDYIGSLFDNLPKFIRPKQVGELLQYSQSTVYDMKLRPQSYGIPAGMFLKEGKRVLVRTDILKAWFMSRCLR